MYIYCTIIIHHLLIKMSKDKREYDEILLIEVQNHPNLHNTEMKDYKNVVKRLASWTAIANSLGG